MEKTNLNILDTGKITVFNAPFESDNILVRKGSSNNGSFFNCVFYVYNKIEKKDESLKELQDDEITKSIKLILRFISTKNLIRLCKNDIENLSTGKQMWKSMCKKYIENLVYFIKHLNNDTDIEKKLVMYIDDEEKRKKYNAIMTFVSVNDVGKIIVDFIEKRKGIEFDEYLKDRLDNLLERNLIKYNFERNKKEKIRNIFLKAHKTLYENALSEELKIKIINDINVLESSHDIKKMICAYINFNVVVINAETRACSTTFDIGAEKTIILLQYDKNYKDNTNVHYELVGKLESGNKINWIFDIEDDSVSLAKSN